LNTIVGSEWLGALTSDHLENWNANTNQQIIYQVAALLDICHPCFHPSNPVELAIDAK
jgi:hypothetical protein